MTSYQVLVALACRYSVMSSNAFKSRSAVGWSVARLGLPAYKPLSVSPEVASDLGPKFCNELLAGLDRIC